MNKSFDTELSQIGKRIYRRRVELGVSGTELAASASISVSTLSNVENGQRNISVKSFCAIAKALEVPLSRLQPGLSMPFRRIIRICESFKLSWKRFRLNGDS